MSATVAMTVNGSNRPVTRSRPTVQRPLQDMSQHPQDEEGSKKTGPNEDDVEDQGLDRAIVNRACTGENDSQRRNAATDSLAAGDDLFCRRSCLFRNLASEGGIFFHRRLNLLCSSLAF